MLRVERLTSHSTTSRGRVSRRRRSTGLERHALVGEVAPQGVRQADAPGAVALQPAPARAVDLAAEAADRRLELALLGGREVEQRAQRPPARRVGGLGCRSPSRRWRSSSASSSSGSARRMSSACAVDGLDELLVDAQLAQVVDELRERRRRQVDRQLLGAGLRRDAAGVERARALHAQLVGHARQRVLQRVGVALEHEVLAEDREPQPLGLAVDVVRRAQLVLGQEAAQVDGLRVLVGVAAVLLGRLALEVLAEPQLRRCAAALVDVRVHRRRAAAARAADRRRGRRAGRRSRRPRRS